MTGGTSPPLRPRPGSQSPKRRTSSAASLAPPGRSCSAGEQAGSRCIPFAAGEGRHRVWGTALLTRRGLSVNLLGGDLPHIGAVAIGIPRRSLARRDRRSATTSVFALAGHKEDEVARSMATELARRLGLPSVVVAGLHVEQARRADIDALLRNADRALQLILAQAAAGARRKRRG